MFVKCEPDAVEVHINMTIVDELAGDMELAGWGDDIELFVGENSTEEECRGNRTEDLLVFAYNMLLI